MVDLGLRFGISQCTGGLALLVLVERYGILWSFDGGR